MVCVDEQGSIMFVNAQAELLFGYGRDALVGHAVEVLIPDSGGIIHPERGDGRRNAIPRRAANLELNGRRRDGTEFPAEISLSATRTGDELLVSIAVRDGTERRQAAIIRSSSDAIISNNLDGTIASWNRGAEKLFGYPAAEVIGKTLDVLVPPAMWADERARLDRAAQGEQVPEYETRRLRADGRPVDVSNTMSPIHDAAGVRGVSTISRDISERKRLAAQQQALEDRLRQSERLESLGQLAGGVAHDFNNLLSVIINYADFVLDEITDGRVRDDVEQIRSSAERAAQLTHQLLIFGRREKSQTETLDLNAIVGDVQALLARSIGEHIDLSVDLAIDLPAIQADRGKIEQILVNLAVNARDAMPQGGKLVVETGLFTVLDEPTSTLLNLRPGHYAQLAVTDTGAGMDDDTIRHALEPFFTTKPKGEGTGLGLATVYGIVTEFGGSIRLYSELGLGTTVRTYLPAAVDPSATIGPHRPAVFEQGHGEIILVVDDEEAVRNVTVRILERNGYRALTAANGPDALVLAESHDFTALLTDVIMPEMSGRELAQHLSERRPGLPVLFLSGYSQGLFGPGQGFDDTFTLIQKPFNERELIERLHEALVTDRSRAPTT
jgi:PAS domain S-box-containing protein